MKFFASMHLKSTSKTLLCFAMLICFFYGCKTNSYVAYELSGKKNQFSLCTSNQSVILIGFSSCIHCLPDLINQCEKDSSIVIISAVVKDELEVYAKYKSLLEQYGNDKRISYLFQYTQKNDLYKYKGSNKLFKDFNCGESPILLKSDSLCRILITKPSDLNSEE